MGLTSASHQPCLETHGCLWSLVAMQHSLCMFACPIAAGSPSAPHQLAGQQQPCWWLGLVQRGGGGAGSQAQNLYAHHKTLVYASFSCCPIQPSHMSWWMENPCNGTLGRIGSNEFKISLNLLLTFPNSIAINDSVIYSNYWQGLPKACCDQITVWK